MSNYRAEALNPKTNRVENADWLDNYFGHRVYAVRFDDGCVYRSWEVGLMAAGKRLAELVKALESLLQDPPATLDEPDTDAEVIIKMRAIARDALGRVGGSNG